MNSIVLVPGKYSLTRIPDGVGSAGGMFHPVDRKNRKDHAGVEGEIKVGFGVICGSYNLFDDWWLTTDVTKIIRVNEEKTKVKFRTQSGSTYIAKSE